MTAIPYNNFDLLIEPTPDGYRARVIASPVGQLAPTTFQLPTTIAPTTDQLRLVGGAIRAAQRGPTLEQPDLTPLNPETFGQELFATVFHDDLRAHLQRSLDRVRAQNHGLRLRLHLDETPELALLPWEYMFNPFAAGFFVLSERTPLVRYPTFAQPETPLRVTLPLHILACIADAQGTGQPLDTAQERARLEEALKEMVDDGTLKITWLEQATQAQLQNALHQAEYHIFHFIGHGWFDEVKGEGGLLFVDKEGRVQEMAARVLGTWLHDHASLRLAFLNACEGARAAEGQPFGSVAQTLVQRGLPAVIAMQFPITDDAAVILAKEFYNAVANGDPVDAALTEARKAIYGQPSLMEWGTPVLFMRADDGYLFYPKEPGILTIIEQAVRNTAAATLQHSAAISARFRKTIAKRPKIYIPLIRILGVAVLALIWWFAVPRPTWTNPKDGAVYVRIPNGELQMGTSNDPSDDQYEELVRRCEAETALNCRDLYKQELPQHAVPVDRFWIMQTEVTNKQYLLCYNQGNGPCTEPGSGNITWQDPTFAAYPITHVNWEQAQIYADWADGRLPTEAEWEMACRGTDGRLYPWGNEDPNRELANYAWNGTQQQPRPVGSYLAGTNELFDMAGNVWEWTSTLYTENYEAQQTEEDREVLETTDDAGARVKRGGSLAEIGLHIRCAYRSANPPTGDNAQVGGIGFRVVHNAR